MNRFFLLLSVVVTWVSCQETTNLETKNETKYFRNIAFRESPYADIKGIIELTSMEAKQCFHYQFDYDTDGRLVKVSQRIGSRNAVFTPDPNRFFVKSPVIAISYKDGEELRQYLNHNQEIMPTPEGVLYEKFSLEEKGTRKQLVFLNEKMRPVQNNWGISTYKWRTTPNYVKEERFDTLGQIVAMRPELNFYRTRLYYDERGFCEKFSNHDKNGNLINSDIGMASDILTYDEKGCFIQWKTYDQEGKNVFNTASGMAQGINFINEKGQAYLTHYLDTNNQLIISKYGYAQFETLYDDWGNVVGWKFYDTKDSLLAVDDAEVAYGKITYDEKRRRIGYSFFNREDELENHAQYGFADIKYQYDDKDRLIEEAFYDEKSNLFLFEPRNAAMIHYDYSKDETRKVTLYDETRSPILTDD